MALSWSSIAALITPHVSNQAKFYLCLLNALSHFCACLIFAGTIFGSAVLVLAFPVDLKIAKF